MNKYHKRFLSSFACENIIGLFTRYKGAAKEITESWAMLEAFKTHIPKAKKQSAIVIGDGCSPRTGTLIAYYTKADVISIDPNFNLGHWEEHKKKQETIGFPIQRLEIYREKIEELLFDKHEQTTIILPHSHASMEACIKTIQAPELHVINMPCCVPIPKEYLEIPHIMYKDFNCSSPKNEIHIWRNL